MDRGIRYVGDTILVGFTVISLCLVLTFDPDATTHVAIALSPLAGGLLGRVFDWIASRSRSESQTQSQSQAQAPKN